MKAQVWLGKCSPEEVVQIFPVSGQHQADSITHMLLYTDLALTNTANG
jgi:hypothetical protein